MRDILNILPINHCIFSGKQFDGGHTYFKANKKSQIDFLITDNFGRRNVEHFELVHSGWHFSDHIPIDLNIRFKYDINSISLLIRSRSTLECVDPVNRSNALKLFSNKKFDLTAAKALLMENAEEISNICHITLSSDFIVNRLHVEMEI